MLRGSDNFDDIVVEVADADFYGFHRPLIHHAQFLLKRVKVKNFLTGLQDRQDFSQDVN